MLRYAAPDTGKPPAKLPSAFDRILDELGYEGQR
jgi:hypothetical protein